VAGTEVPVDCARERPILQVGELLVRHVILEEAVEDFLRRLVVRVESILYEEDEPPLVREVNLSITEVHGLLRGEVSLKRGLRGGDRGRGGAVEIQPGELLVAGVGRAGGLEELSHGTSRHRPFDELVDRVRQGASLHDRVEVLPEVVQHHALQLAAIRERGHESLRETFDLNTSELHGSLLECARRTSLPERLYHVPLSVTLLGRWS
jgi:hypothetical protein